tara:strand:- start:66 stop:233 length:168 start_codon:yes stop_codon:yes gene_type:complete
MDRASECQISITNAKASRPSRSAGAWKNGTKSIKQAAMKAHRITRDWAASLQTAS